MKILDTIIKEIILFLKNTKPFFRFLFYLGLLIFAWFINDSLGFIRNHRISNKIEQIESLEKIIQSKEIDSLTKKSLQEYEGKIIQRESLLERLYLVFEKSSDTTVKKNAGTVQVTITNKNSSNIVISNVSRFFCIYFLLLGLE